jgi:DUF1680 family protein
MIAADYRISTCFTDSQGIYVNLYVPAQVTWSRNNETCGLSIQTDYPYAAAVVMTLRLPSAQIFTLNLRIPAWAQGAGLSINGKRETRTLTAGRFAAIRREWRADDRIELELPLTQRLESIDAAHPQTVALLAGPLVLMQLLEEGDSSAASPVPRASLLAAQRGRSRHEWQASLEGGFRTLKPFLDIDAAESYSAYQDVLPS